MSARKVRILLRMGFPEGTVRLFFGSGTHLDKEGNCWRGFGQLPEGAITNIEYAFSGEASRLNIGLSGIPQEIADAAYEETQESDIIGSPVQILLQACNADFNPLDTDPVVKFTGEVVDINFSRAAISDTAQPYVKHQVMLSVANAFHTRKSRRNAVLSDADQQAFSLQQNPDLPADRFCQRITLMAGQTITWPRF